MRPLALLFALLLVACPLEDEPDDDDVTEEAPGACGSGGAGGPIGEGPGQPGVPSYRILVPESYDGLASVPLLVALHGSYGTGATMTAIWGDVAEAEGFVVVGPDSGSTFGWNTATDVDRIFTIVDRVTRDYDIDRCRIQLVGHSSGAHMTWVVGLAHSDVFASLGAYAGSLSSAEQLGIWPDEVTRPIPARIDHGLDDDVVPISASEHARDELEAAGHAVDFNPIPDSGHPWDAEVTAAIWASMSAHALEEPGQLPAGARGEGDSLLPQ